ncbi:FAD binding domain-containing protein [Azospirillum halopraeferens]|uniref:FAD binding domain-containing protein n=1 Tax=Azospirillum halopraeferens TaxID=34010 RepID=UPI00048CC12F|nr:xanthine dehydrogenase family protein subunit M [Azospirillum halopraeferens]
MEPIAYSVPTSAEQAVSELMSEAGACYVAGGTSLFDLMKLRVERPSRLIDITRIGYDAISTSGSELRIGANATMSNVAENPTIARDYPILTEALLKGASQQLRNMATVGANLLQRTRCSYFRHGAGAIASAGSIYPCNKREPGSGCAAIGGLDRTQAVLGVSGACTAVSPGDWPVALTALDARINIFGPNGRRDLPVSGLYRLPGNTPHLEFDLKRGELITEIIIPKTASGLHSTYHKVRDRESYAFALASAAVALELNGWKIEHAHVALGGVATRPWRAPETEQFLIGKTIRRETALEAARLAFVNAQPGRHNGFKVELGIRTLADALMIASERTRTV